MKRTFCKVLSLAIVCVMLAAMFAIGSSAAPGDIKYTVTGTTTPTTLDGVIADGEYAGNAPIVLDGSGANTEGDGWIAGGAWPGHVYTFYYTWDADYLYVGITVQGDTTPFQEFDANTDWFGNADEVQMGFNPNYEIEGAMPVIISVGFTADTAANLNGDAYRSTEDGSQNKAINGEFNSYSKAYSADGINYCAEAAIPWHDYIFVKGVGRSSDGAPFYDFSGMTPEAGLEIGLWYACMDDGNGEGADWSVDHGFRTDMTTGAGWVAEEMSSIAIVLADAPAAADVAEETDAPVVDDAPAADTGAAQTFDGIIVLAVVASLSAAGVVIGKKKSK